MESRVEGRPGNGVSISLSRSDTIESEGRYRPTHDRLVLLPPSISRVAALLSL
jgi:hypothetical protein